jgi:hypothetical protein
MNLMTLGKEKRLIKPVFHSGGLIALCNHQ